MIRPVACWHRLPSLLLLLPNWLSIRLRTLDPPSVGSETTTILYKICRCILRVAQAGVSGNSRSRPFPRMNASYSCSRIMRMFFSFPYHSWIMGIVFLFPSRSGLWEWIFSFPSHSLFFYFTDGNQNGNWITMRDTIFFRFHYISQNNYIRR